MEGSAASDKLEGNACQVFHT